MSAETMEAKKSEASGAITEVFRCPACKGALAGAGAEELRCEGCEVNYGKEGDVWRFIGSQEYASSFGYQWKRFAKVQLDSCNGTDFSEQRFRGITGWDPGDLKDARVLDVGCGAGRFTEVALKFGGNVVAMDLSEAVDACRENHPSDRLTVCQGSIYEMPFAPGSFDYAFCIGVIQHTPDPRASIEAIARMVRPGGRIGLWIYERDWKAYFGTIAFKYLLRPWTMRMSRERQLVFTKRITDFFLPVARWGRTKGIFGKFVMRWLPICSAHLEGVGLNDEDFDQWVFLDTFDMYSPAHDHPMRYAAVAKLLGELGFEKIERMPHGGISIVGVKAV